MNQSPTSALLRRERLLVRSVATLMVLLFLTTGGSLFATVLALNARQDTVDRATRRISTLQNDLSDARIDIADLSGQNAEANTKLDAVLAQLAILGVSPVVTSTPAPPSARSGSRSSTPSTTTTTTGPPSPGPPTTDSPPNPQPQPQPEPDPQPEPTPDRPALCTIIPVPVLCTGGALP